MKFASEKIIVNQSMAASFESQPILLDQIYGFSFQAVFTGAPEGSFKLQVSNDDKSFGFTPVNWTDVTGSTQIITEAGDIVWNFNGAFYKWVKVVYTRDAGTGSCDVTYSSKGA
jgi:hypothetical protein